MSVDLQEYVPYPITDFSGGLNEFASNYKVSKSEFVECKNITLRDSGSIKLRPGYRMYQNQSYGGNNITSAINGAHRYIRSDGTKKIMFYSGINDASDHVLVDSDDGNFSKVGSCLSNDGRLRFVQWMDTVIMGTDRDGLKTYNSAADNTFFSPAPSGVVGGAYSPFEISAVDGTGSLKQKKYLYAYSFNIGHGNDFLGESEPVYFPANGDAHYRMNEIDMLAFSGDTGLVKLHKNELLFLPDNPGFPHVDITGINIYRSLGLDSYPDSWNGIGLSDHFTDMFLVGMVTAEDWAAASDYEVLFTDPGINFGANTQQIQYGIMQTPPKGRYMAIHKNRMWWANVKYTVNSTSPSGLTSVAEGEINAPHRVFFSQINQPLVTWADWWEDIDVSDGDGVTGMISFRNELLLVFKPNSTWAFYGDNPQNFSKKNVSQTVGCIAPDSIEIVGDIVTWLSNSGVYYYDGSFPKPLKSDNIYTSLSNIPDSMKKTVVSAYDPDRKELLLAHGGPATGGYNKLVTRFDVRTQSWTQDEYPVGFSSFVIKKSIDDPVTVIAGVHGPINASHTQAYILNRGYGDSQLTGAYPQNLTDFGFKTKSFDCGYPFEDKVFKAVLIELTSAVDLVLDYKLDGRYDSEALGTPETIPRPPSTDLVWSDVAKTGGLNTRYYNVAGHPDYESGNPTTATVWLNQQSSGTLVYLPVKHTWGKRMQLYIHGSTRSLMAIESITLFYKKKEKVREN